MSCAFLTLKRRCVLSVLISLAGGFLLLSLCNTVLVFHTVKIIKPQDLVHKTQFSPPNQWRYEGRLGNRLLAENMTHEDYRRYKRTIGVSLNGSHLKYIDQVIKSHERPDDKVYGINISASDAESAGRLITDTRVPACKAISYQLDTLPTASVVIPFYNEALSLLVRTVVSVLRTSPAELLEEIILVDDKSSYKYLGEDLAGVISKLPKVRLLRNAKREGLIRSRLRGADDAKGSVIIFLDAHTECNQGWLEPILSHIRLNRQTVVQPFVDGINIETFEYAAPKQMHKGAFSWDLRYVWMGVPEHIQREANQNGRPFWSPTLIGCAMAIDRDYFTAIGRLDEDLNFWGGENLELAFRTWMCGGSVVTLPCSRVGHVFREIPYRDEDNWERSWIKNLMRVAEIWMGDYKKYFYASTKVYKTRRANFTESEKKTLQKRIKLRDKMRCKTFDWYLAHVIPEVDVPPYDSAFHGEIMNMRSRACWRVTSDGYVVLTFKCYGHKVIPENVFTLNKNGMLMYKDRCIVPDHPRPALKLEACTKAKGDEIPRWKVDLRDPKWGELQVRVRNINFCIWQVTNALPVHKGEQMPQTEPCRSKVIQHNQFARWSFTYRFDLLV